MPTSRKLRPFTDKALRPSDQPEGPWTRLELIDMDVRFCQAMQRAPERPRGDGPDRVAAGLLPPRRP